MEEKPLLSVCINTHNEEKNIKKCLAAVYDWVDEIILVDGESIDKTVEIAKSLGKKIKVFEYDNPRIFIKNAARALDKATGKWILRLDADEIVTEKLKKEIIQITCEGQALALSCKGLALSEGLTLPVVFQIPRLNYFLGQPLTKGGVYPDYVIRLFKNGTVYFKGETIHDQAELKNPQAVIGQLKNALIHYPYENFDQYLSKWKHYCLVEAQILADQGVKPSVGNFLKYVCFLPKWWFLKTYFRHRGYVDGMPGFIFSLFSSLRFIVTYVYLYERSKES